MFSKNSYKKMLSRNKTFNLRINRPIDFFMPTLQSERELMLLILSRLSKINPLEEVIEMLSNLSRVNEVILQEFPFGKKKPKPITKNLFEGLIHFLTNVADKGYLKDFLEFTLPYMADKARLVFIFDKEKAKWTRPNSKDNYASRTIVYTRAEIATIIAAGYFCTYPELPRSQIVPPGLNFINLYKSLLPSEQHELGANCMDPAKVSIAKLKCIHNYFYRLQQEEEATRSLKGEITVLRYKFPTEIEQMIQLQDNKSMICPMVVSGDGVNDITGVEDGSPSFNSFITNFSTPKIGKTMLSNKAGQEETVLCEYPEAMIVMLTQCSLSESEVLYVRGCQRYSKTTWDGPQFKYQGNFKDHRPRDTDGNFLSTIVFMVPTDYSKDPNLQYSEKDFKKEVKKILMGFSQPHKANYTMEEIQELRQLHPEADAYNQDATKMLCPITGNWGCGSFKGDPQMKCVMQWLVASHLRLPVLFYVPFHHHDLARLGELHEYFLERHYTVEDLLRVLTIVCKTIEHEITVLGKPHTKIFDYILRFKHVHH